MTTDPHEARGMRCERCGAGFPVTALAPTVACPYCRNVQPVAPELVQQLAQYQQATAARAADVHATDQASAQAQRASAEVSALWFQGSGAGYVMMCGPACVLMGSVWLLEQLGLIPRKMRLDVEEIAQLVAGILTAVCMVGYTVYRKRRARRGRPTGELAPRSAVVCPSCGAPNVLAPGQVIHACGHCRAAMMPTQAVIQRVMSAAEAEARRARMHWFRIERRTRLRTNVGSLAESVVLAVVCALVAVAAGGIVPWLMIAGSREVAPYALAVTIAGWAFGALAVVGVTFMIKRDLGRQKRWAAITVELATRLGGQALDGAGVRRWLDTYWAGALNDDALGYCGGGVAAVLDGFPALLIVDVVGSHADHHPKVLLLVAATFTGTARLARGPLNSWIEAQAFAALADEGGIMALMGGNIAAVYEDHQRRLAQLAAHPEQALSVTEVLGALVRVTAMSGGSPAPAMPG